MQDLVQVNPSRYLGLKGQLASLLSAAVLDQMSYIYIHKLVEKST